MSKDGIFRIPEPTKQTLVLNSEHLILAVERLGENIPDFANFFPNFDPDREIPAPYVFIYHSMRLFDYVVPHLLHLEHDLLEQLNESVLASHGQNTRCCKAPRSQRYVSRRLVKYLVRPSDVLVRTQDFVPHAYVATTWAKEGKPDREASRKSEEGRPLTLNAEKNQGPRKRTYILEVAAWSWAFDGSFVKKRTTIKIQLKVGDEDDEVRIDSLNYFPLRFDEGGLHKLHEVRGKMFWRCCTKRFVSYSDDETFVLGSVSVRQKLNNNHKVFSIIN